MTGGSKVLALGHQHAAAYSSIAHVLTTLGHLTYRHEQRFKHPIDCLQFVRAHGYDLVVMPNPYGNAQRLAIYQLLREAKFPVVVFDRGGLPRSWFFDVGFNADSPSYHVDKWDKPLSDAQRACVREYLETVKKDLEPLEAQGERIGGAALRTKLGLGNRKVLFVPLQRPSDTTVRYFCAPMRDRGEFETLVNDIGDRMKGPLANWVVVAKKHPLESVRSDLRATFVSDDTHINDLIELADAVLVLNSGTGLLSLCWNKPVLIAGTACYADQRLNTQVRSVDDVAAALSEPREVDAETRDRFIHHLITSVYSFGDFRTELVAQNDGSSRNITRHIEFDCVRFPIPRKRRAVLFVTSVVPWPITRGAAHRTDQTLTALAAQDVDIDVLCLNQTEADATSESLMERLRQRYPGLRHIMVHRHPKLARSFRPAEIASRAGYQLAHLIDGISRRGHTINCAAHCPPGFARELRSRLRQVSYAAIWFNYLRVMPRELSTQARIICDLHDYQTERIKADVLPGLPEQRREHYLHRFKSNEARTLDRCDLAIAISPVEMARITEELKPKARVVCLPATDYQRTKAPSERLQFDNDLLFVGSRSDANIAGMSWFLRETFPLIVAERPSIRLRIHGTIIEMPKLRQLLQERPAGGNVVLTGPTPTMDAAYASARVIICPIRHGTGMKIKVVEAMAHGKAIVATSVAGEGIATDLGLEFFDTPRAFADACLRLLLDGSAREERQRIAKATFARDHAHAQLCERLTRLLEELEILD